MNPTLTERTNNLTTLDQQRDNLRSERYTQNLDTNLKPCMLVSILNRLSSIARPKPKLIPYDEALKACGYPLNSNKEQ